MLNYNKHLIGLFDSTSIPLLKMYGHNKAMVIITSVSIRHFFLEILLDTIYYVNVL